MASHPRTLPFDGHTALSNLRGQVAATQFTDGVPASVAQPVADLLRSPDGARDRQLLLGAPVTVIADHDTYRFVQAECGYVGYLRADALSPEARPTHVLRARASHAYSQPDLKSPDRLALPFGARLTVTDEQGRFARTNFGYIPMQHLAPAGTPMHDPVDVARIFLGTPYLWGGNSIWGIDCSGLVQTAHRACAIGCPGDADMQQAGLGDPLPDDAELKRGDIVFWIGHVGMIAGPNRLIHSNAHAMSVTEEDFDAACARIARSADGSTGSGAPVARRRLRPN